MSRVEGTYPGLNRRLIELNKLRFGLSNQDACDKVYKLLKTSNIFRSSPQLFAGSRTHFSGTVVLLTSFKKRFMLGSSQASLSIF